MDTNQKLWFKAKKYGWGWTPCSMEGWLVIIVYCIAIVFELFSTNFQAPVTSILFEFIPTIILFTIVLIVICFATGEKPSWRWGDKK
jgi:hypothetical protein